MAFPIGGQGTVQLEVKVPQLKSLLGCLPRNLTEVTIMGIWGFPKIRGTFLGVPIVRIIVFGGLYWGSPIQGKYTWFTPI